MTCLQTVFLLSMTFVGSVFLRQTIDVEDANHLMDQMKAGKLLMVSPMDLQDEMIGFITRDKFDKTKARLYNISASLLTDKLDLSQAEPSIDLEEVWPKLFEKPDIGTAPWASENVFKKWLETDTIENMVIYKSSSPKTPFLLVGKKMDSSPNGGKLFYGLQYGIKWNYTEPFLRAVSIKLKVNDQIPPYDDPNSQGTWIGVGNVNKEKETDHTSFLTIGKVKGKWVVDSFIFVNQFTVVNDINFNSNKRNQMCLVNENEEQTIRLDKTCPNGKKSKRQVDSLMSQPFPQVFRGIIINGRAYLLTGDGVYIFNSPDFGKTQGKFKFTKLNYNDFVILPKESPENPTPLPKGQSEKDPNRKSIKSNDKSETASSNPRMFFIILGPPIIFVILVLVIIISVIYCPKCNAKKENADKPKEVIKWIKPPNFDQPKVQSKKSKKPTSKVPNSVVSVVPCLPKTGEKSKVIRSSMSTSTSHSKGSNAIPSKVIKESSSLTGAKSSVAKDVIGKSSIAKSCMAKSSIAKSCIAKTSMAKSCIAKSSISQTKSNAPKMKPLKSKAPKSKSSKSRKSSSVKGQKTVMGVDVASLASLGAPSEASSACTKPKSTVAKSNKSKSKRK